MITRGPRLVKRSEESSHPAAAQQSMLAAPNPVEPPQALTPKTAQEARVAFAQLFK